MGSWLLYFLFYIVIVTWRLVLRAQIRFLFYNKQIGTNRWIFFLCRPGHRAARDRFSSHVSGEKLFLCAFVDTRILISPFFFYSLYRVTEFEIFRCDSQKCVLTEIMTVVKQMVFFFFFCIKLTFLLSVAIRPVCSIASSDFLSDFWEYPTFMRFKKHKYRFKNRYFGFLSIVNVRYNTTGSCVTR